jgi:signal transduction histidine kinase
LEHFLDSFLGGIEMILTETRMMTSQEDFHPLPHDQVEGESAPTNGRFEQSKLQQLAREVQDIAGLYNIAVAAGSSLNLEEIIWAIYKESGRVLDTTNFAITLYDAHSDLLNFALVFDRGRKAGALSIPRAAYQSLTTQVLDTQAPLLINDLLTVGPLLAVRQPPRSKERQMRSWLGVPIVNPVRPEEGVQGVIATWRYRPDAFTDRELGLLSAIGTQAAIALRNSGLYQSVLAEKERVIEAQEQARRALARDLHDGPTQVVSAILMHLDYCQQLLERQPDRLADELRIAKDLTRQAVDEIRTLLFELRPLVLETEGLVAAVRVFLKRRQRDAEGTTQLSLKVRSLDSTGELLLPEEKIEAALFAIAQEAVNNALKHAEARNIVVELGETPTEIYVKVNDDGNGFDVAAAKDQSARQGSLGMVNLRERAELIGGQLQLHSEPGQGTEVMVRVPKAEEERKKRRGATGPLRATRER